MAKITPHLWYSSEAEEAARFYAQIFPNSRVDRVSAVQHESPSGPPGSVKIVEFTLLGQPFMAISAGPLDPFNHAVSFVVTCEEQAEIDRYWYALLKGGAMMTDPDQEKARRAGEAMMKMVKLNIAGLQAAFNSNS